MLALALADDRRKKHQLAAFRKREDLVDHLADRLGFQWSVMVRAAWRARARIEQPQVVVDLGDGADGGTWVVGGRLLLDGYGRREPFDGIDVGLFHHREKLPGICRQRLDVAALALGIKRVEGQRGLARTRQASDHDQFVAWQGQVDVFQVVGTSPTNQNLVQSSLARRAKTRKYTARGDIAAK